MIFANNAFSQYNLHYNLHLQKFVYAHNNFVGRPMNFIKLNEHVLKKKKKKKSTVIFIPICANDEDFASIDAIDDGIVICVNDEEFTFLLF